MARRKNLTREFDSAIDVDFLKNRILHDAFAKLAAEQDAYNEQMGYPANGTTGELPIQEAKYGGMQYQTGGRQKFQAGSRQTYTPTAEEIAAWNLQHPEYLSSQGYGAINTFENGRGTFDANGNPVGMGKGDNYAQTADKTIIEDFINKNIGKDVWNKMPDELRTQVYSFAFNHGIDTPEKQQHLLSGLAEAVQNSDMDLSKQYKSRQNMSTDEALAVVKGANYQDPNIYNNYVNTLGSQYKSISEHPGNNIPVGYQPTMQSRAVDINAAYWGKPMTKSPSEYWNNKNYIPPPSPSSTGGKGQIQPLGYPVSNVPDRDQIWNNTNYGSGISGNAGTIGSAGIQAPGVNPYLPKMAKGVMDDSGVATKPVYESDHDKYESAKELLKRLYNTEGYKDTTWDKVGKGMAFAPAALTAIAAMQKDKYPKFPHYTPTDLNIDPAINDLINQGQLNTNNVMDRLRSQSGSAGSYMTNAITASGQSQENTARSIMQLRMEAAARNKAATDQAGQFNAQTSKEQILAEEERKGKRWTDAGNALGLAAANLNSMNKENKMNWAGKEARKDQLAAIYAQMGFGKADIAKLELELGIPPIQQQTGGRLKFNKKQNYFSFL